MRRSAAMSPVAHAFARACRIPRSASSRFSTFSKHGRSSSGSSLNSLMSARGLSTLTGTVGVVMASRCFFADFLATDHTTSE